MNDFFNELKDWSARKHRLVSNYLTGFTRILGGSRGLVYYIDGFAGPGLYGEKKEKGSPILAAEYGATLTNKNYSLKCINVEANDSFFQNLVENTKDYGATVTNLHGTFDEHSDLILSQTAEHPSLFFLDPFGVKGLEWDKLCKILHRQPITELLLRIDPVAMRRLAGHYDAQNKQGGRAKVELLTKYFGFNTPDSWYQAWQSGGENGLVSLYIQRLTSEMNRGKGSFGCTYPIREIEGRIKYHLGFVTRDPSGAILMNDTVCNAEEKYENEVEEFKKAQGSYQLSMFDLWEPSPEEVAKHRLDELKTDIYQAFRGKTASRLDIQAKMFDKWFGRLKGTHYTQALKEMSAESNPRILRSSSNKFSDKYTKFTFRP